MEAIKSPRLAEPARSPCCCRQPRPGRRLRADSPARSAPCHEESRRARQLELVRGPRRGLAGRSVVARLRRPAARCADRGGAAQLPRLGPRPGTPQGRGRAGSGRGRRAPARGDGVGRSSPRPSRATTSWFRGRRCRRAGTAMASPPSTCPMSSTSGARTVPHWRPPSRSSALRRWRSHRRA